MLFDAWECKYSEKRDEGKISITSSVVNYYTYLISKMLLLLSMLLCWVF